jgi:ferredoxin
MNATDKSRSTSTALGTDADRGHEADEAHEAHETDKTAPMMAIAVDPSYCSGHGKCYRISPENFRSIDDDGHAEFIGSPVARSDRPRIARGDAAIDRCPEEALSWVPA